MSYRTHAMQTVAPSLRVLAPMTCETDGFEKRYANNAHSRFSIDRGSLQLELLRSMRTTLPGPTLRMRTVPVGATLRGLGGVSFRGIGAVTLGDASTDALNTQMTTIVQQLRDAYQVGLRKIQDAHGTGLVDFVTGTSDEAASTAAAYKQLPHFIDQLDGDLRQAVISGTNAAGDPYTIDRWLSFATKDVRDAIEKMTGYSLDTSGWEVVRQTAIATGRQVESGLGVAIPLLGAAALIGGVGYLLIVTGAAGPLFSRIRGAFKKPSRAMAGVKAGSRRRKPKSKR